MTARAAAALVALAVASGSAGCSAPEVAGRSVHTARILDARRADGSLAQPDSARKVGKDGASAGSRGDASGAEAQLMPTVNTNLSVIFIAIDGARWQDIFHGPDKALLARESSVRFAGSSARDLTPNLHALLDAGIGLGDQERFSFFDASGPNFVSLPGYTEMLSGRISMCKNNDCALRPDPTVVDAFRALPGTTDEEIAVISSWERIAQIAAHDQMRVVESCGRTHGDTRLAVATDFIAGALASLGPQISPRPGWADYRPDALTGPIAIHYVDRVHPRFLFLSLGDTDEWGHANNYTEYLNALVRSDAIIGELVRVSARFADPTNLLWVVTADHGRSAGFRDHGEFAPESSATWLIAKGPGVDARGALWFTPHHYLRDIAPTLRARIGGAVEDLDEAGLPIAELMGTARTNAEPTGAQLMNRGASARP